MIVGQSCVIVSQSFVVGLLHLPTHTHTHTHSCDDLARLGQYTNLHIADPALRQVTLHTVVFH